MPLPISSQFLSARKRLQGPNLSSRTCNLWKKLLRLWKKAHLQSLFNSFFTYREEAASEIMEMEWTQMPREAARELSNRRQCKSGT